MIEVKKDNGAEITAENMIVTSWMETSKCIQPPTHNTKGNQMESGADWRRH